MPKQKVAKFVHTSSSISFSNSSKEDVLKNINEKLSNNAIKNDKNNQANMNDEIINDSQTLENPKGSSSTSEEPSSLEGSSSRTNVTSMNSAINDEETNKSVPVDFSGDDSKKRKSKRSPCTNNKRAQKSSRSGKQKVNETSSLNVTGKNTKAPVSSEKIIDKVNTLKEVVDGSMCLQERLHLQFNLLEAIVLVKAITPPLAAE